MEVENRERLKRLLNEKISFLFRSLEALSPFLLLSEQAKFQRLCAGELSLEELSQSLAFLSPILARIYKRPLFFLLDE